MRRDGRIEKGGVGTVMACEEAWLNNLESLDALLLGGCVPDLMGVSTHEGIRGEAMSSTSPVCETGAT